MEIFTDVHLFIDGQIIRDDNRLKRVLSDYRLQTTGSGYTGYTVKGTYSELERLVNKLSGHLCLHDQQGQTAQQTSSPLRTIPSSHQTIPRSHPTTVSQCVMNYIYEKCPDKLKKIHGDGFQINYDPANSDGQGTVQVTFSPQSRSSFVDRVHLDLVRQRFVTFYQRTASDLQQTSLHLDPHQSKELQRKFPLLLFEAGSGSHTTVYGPFAHVQKLKEFQLQNLKSPGSSPVKKSPTRCQSVKSSTPSPGRSKPPEDESCPICMEPIPAEKKKALRCKHSFCRDCLQTAFDYKPVCPICGEVYGVLTGTQPDGGTMNVQTVSTPLPGYKRYGTIVIHYDIPSGIQKKEHPNPGQPFQGASRTAYLPDSPEGREVLGLLSKAFNQRLIFTIGRSSTSGRNNMVTWNDIHHKTSMDGGPTCYGYPDPDYLDRVREELKAKGIK